MAVSNRKDKKLKPELTIFEEQTKAKRNAKTILKLAKEQEAKKIKEGYRYVSSGTDGKTKVLTNKKK